MSKEISIQFDFSTIKKKKKKKKKETHIQGVPKVTWFFKGTANFCKKEKNEKTKYNKITVLWMEFIKNISNVQQIHHFVQQQNGILQPNSELFNKFVYNNEFNFFCFRSFKDMHREFSIHYSLQFYKI